MRTPHPFGELLSRLRARKPGLTQAKLAELTGYDLAVIARMGQGQKDLTGPLARERILRVIQSLDECGVLNGVDEANVLLEAATLPPLFAGNYSEAELLQQLALHRHAAPADDLSLPFAPRHNLPAQLTSFIGREQEIAQVTLFLAGPITPPMPATSKNLHARKKSDARLITLTGPGGVGKTRLALEVAAALCEDYADGAWWVSLGALSDPSLLTQAILTTFELNRQAQAAPLNLLVGYLEKRRLLLVLDNCEHLVDACAELAAHLMSYCPNLRILATSREALQVPGEVTLRVPPLTVPRPALADTNNVMDFDAVRLFVERAQAMRPDFDLTAANASAVAHICERLDGIPLALELAAALMQVLSVEEIAARMDNRFSLLKGGYRTVTPRHQALSNAVDWSYELLTPAEQILLARLSVFAGSWNTAAAEGICADDKLKRADVLPTLRQLVNKSLVVVEATVDESSRYRLLKTIHEYATEKLRERSEYIMMKDNHLTYLVNFAETANVQLHADQEDPAVWASLIEQRDELLAALTHAEQSGNTEALLRLAAALQSFWVGRGLREEGTQWMNKALALGKAAPARLRAALMFAWAWTFERDAERLKQLTPEAEACLAECSAAQDTLGMAQAQTVLGGAAAESGEYSKARAHFDEALRFFEAQGDPWAIANVRHKIGDVLHRAGSPTTETWMRESIQRYRDSGENKKLSTALADLAWWIEAKEPGNARILDVWRESVAAAEAAGNVGLRSEFLLMLGRAELSAGDRAQASDHFAQSLQIACDMDSKSGIESVVEVMRDVDSARAELILEAYLLRKQQAGD